MAMTRRTFLKCSGAAAGSFFGAGLFGHPLLQRVLADTIGDRYFVVLYLDGGNDGLNTVTPVDNGGGSLRTDYETHRLTGAGGLRLTPADLGATHIGTDPNTGATLAFHPALTGLKQIYDVGAAAVIQGCGYPEYNLSHEQSRHVWQRADPFAMQSTGWLGRYLAANYTADDIPALNIQTEVAGDFQTTATSVLALQRIVEVQFPYDPYFYGPNDIPQKRELYLALHAAAAASAQPTLQYLGTAGTATLLSSESYPACDSLYRTDRPGFNASYDAVAGGLAADLREIAKAIYGVEKGVPGVTSRFFETRNGGYDTHSNQGAAAANGQHTLLHREVGDSLQTFVLDLFDMGVFTKTCIIVWSEFSRRPTQNDNGTDHGSQGPMFVIGGGVAGGIYGNHPNIDPLTLDIDGNTVYSQDGTNGFRSTDLRDVYGTVLKHWLNMPEATILSSITPPDVGDPTLYWTAPNLDMGFLP